MTLVLASRSPQRRAILEQLGVAFEVMVPGVEELEVGPPEELVAENAWRKASVIAAAAPGCTVLGVDTTVALGSELFGKPADRAAAALTLRALSGHEHRVLSGVCLIGPEDPRPRTATAVTRVRFRRLDDETLSWYLGGDEWRDRAGGYAIQGRGAALVAGIDGDYLNVVGLPLAALLELAPELLFQGHG